jgi:hypothetical protein
MKLLNIETPVTRNFIPQILLKHTRNFTSIRLATKVMTKASSDLRQSISVILKTSKKRDVTMRSGPI